MNICTHCSTENTDTAKFCEKCGNDILKKTEVEPINKNNNTYKSKWWFRLIIVFYALIFVGSLTLVTILAIDSYAPRFLAYKSTFSYKCTDGYVGGNFKYGDQGVESFNYPIRESNSFYINNLGSIKVTKLVCSNINIRNIIANKEDWRESIDMIVKISRGEFDQEVPEENNFEIFVSDPHYMGSWGELIKYGTIYIVIVLVVLIAMRYTFFFVVTGKHKLIFNEKIRRKN